MKPKIIGIKWLENTVVQCDTLHHLGNAVVQLSIQGEDRPRHYCAECACHFYGILTNDHREYYHLAKKTTDLHIRQLVHSEKQSKANISFGWA